MGCGTSYRKVIVVTGATGQQGGAVLRHLLNTYSNYFDVKALTRDPEKAKAKIPIGAEIVKGDFNDVESLKEAFKGAYGVFCVTDFWHMSEKENEKTHAKNLADACKHNNVSHVVWSTLEDSRPTLKNKAPSLHGDYTVPHFDGKFESNQFFNPNTTTFLYTSFYYENFLFLSLINKVQNNLTIAFNMGDVPLPMVAVDDIGKSVANIFANKLLIGKSAYVASDILTCNQIAEHLGKKIGNPVSYYNMDDETYRGLPFPGAKELGNMFAFKREYKNFAENRKQQTSKVLKNPIKFDVWLNTHAEAIKKNIK
jgi:uncharacterized protein YbjT (DUF2867 family)